MPLTKLILHGYISLPTAPGLDSEVDEVEAAKHPFQQEVLMQWWHPNVACDSSVSSVATIAHRAKIAYAHA